MVQRLPTYDLTMQQRQGPDDDGSVKVNVKQLNCQYEHNFNDEISLIIGDPCTNKVVFYEEKM